MQHIVSDIAFTPTVKAVQERLGSRAGYAKMEQRGGWRDTVTPDLAHFIAERDSFYLATTSADGRPYIQHRGGPPGFLKVLDEHTLAFADFNGNRQYISMGNLAENDQAFIFLMDYPNRRRIKIWGRAEVVEDDPDLDAAAGGIRSRQIWLTSLLSAIPFLSCSLLLIGHLLCHHLTNRQTVDL